MRTALTDALSRLPLVAAPMAGGPTTAALAGAVSDAGAFAFLAGGYKTADALAGELRAVRAAGHDVGVNLFVPSREPVDRAAFARYAAELQPEADRYGIDLSSAVPVEDDDGWQDKLDLLLSEPVPLVSTTFGLPSPAALTALQRAGSQVLVTVTSADEARAAADAGADGLVVQASGAGGHSGIHDPHAEPAPVSVADLTREVVATTGLPVIAGGGIDGAAAVQAVVDAGAAAAAVGTLLLRTDESGASQTHKDALADPAFSDTVLTRAFTGRLARGLRNAFTDAHSATAPVGYPAVHHLTRRIRREAAAAGDPHRVHLWAGTGFRHATAGPARLVVESLTHSL